MASKSPDESGTAKPAMTAGETGKPATGSSTAGAAAKPSATGAKSSDSEKKDSVENGSKGRKNGANGPAVTMLMEDHRAVEKLFGEYEKAKEPRKREIISTAAKALIIHTMLEEEIFYPACREAFSDEDDLDEAQVEHDGVKVLITDLLHGSPDDQYRDAKFKVLSEYVRHHVREEEDADGIFTTAHKEGIDTPQLAQAMTERKSELERAGRLPEPQPRALRSGVSSSFHRQSSPRESGGEERTRGQSRYFEENDMGSYQQYRGRDDDDHGSRRGGSSGNDRPRDEDGRFMSSGRGGRDDDDRYGRSGRGGGSQSYRDDDRSGSGSRSGRGGRDDDDRRDDRGQSGWFGDSRGHSEASRRGWDNPDHGRSGWFGDSEGHSEASRRGWDDRGGSRSGSSRGGRDDDDRGSSRSSRSRDDDDRSGSRSGRGGSSRDDDDRGDDRGHGGWFGDSRGHSEASRRGWESRR